MALLRFILISLALRSLKNHLCFGSRFPTQRKRYNISTLSKKSSVVFLNKITSSWISLTRYIGIIRKRDGFAGLYTGLVPRVAAMGLTQKVEEEFDKYWPPLEEEEGKKEIDGDEDDEEAIAR